jgi:imidazolonepropionase-like amidohydrolase
VRAAAARHGLPVIGHVPHVAFDAPHVDEVQHLTGIAGSGADGEPSALAAVLSGWDSVGEGRIDAAVQTSVERRIAHTPTLGVIDRALELGDPTAVARDPAVLLLPRYYRDLLWNPGATAGWALPPLDAAAAARIRANFCATVRKLHDAGVVLHVGSDAMNPFVVPGASLHEELRRFAECGFTAEQAWQAATSGNAQALRAPQLGRLEAGAPADLLVFANDPSRDLAALATLEAVVADGRLYTRGDLARERARYEAYFASWLYDRAMMLVVALFADREGAGER